MAGKDVAAASAALTANGTTAGVVTVASTTPFRANAIAWLSGTALTSKKVKIVSITDATHLTVRILPDDLALDATSGGVAGVRNLGDFGPSYGTSDVSTFTTVASSTISMDRQFIYDEPR